ncbi:hypothetical protein CGCF415_v001011 [Colletotrichum fructicola]|uniref:Duf427 domain protein n=5 Tax=Colletotrichum gloeosporioides species complex TaxID=2707338 RepID=L2GFY4_COLFN|nr:uncharacterized protein CGMCC3_g6000 [Colletotrichum fructicola]XP_045266299.1 uncharacterized protein GCG54_00013474 [Colletotrichum gloeosporioides]KAF0330158.1 duf427 domain protein [Colletotrichum asianum]KAF4488824.1 hypothetical protein CGGC5_v003983 [Colletotrichum fructicola Nara gc5]KAF4823661.1 hypothetical protein CGCSCA5_v001412 [Colletotrichum siamense]KAF4920171.1 hypothetical protein CGCVW01_v007146 [Colletotrichum viniferum]KAH9242084.1 hypothetical protein K456DRAFT_171868
MTKSGKAKAVVNGTTVAETTEWEEVEGNVYFPPSAVKSDILEKTSHTTFCPWKGTAEYYSLKVGGDKLENAAWYYPTPKDAASEIKDHVAFYKSKVTVSVE